MLMASHRAIKTAQMTNLAVFRIGDISLFLVMIKLYDVGWAGLNTGLAAYATSNFTNWHLLIPL